MTGRTCPVHGEYSATGVCRWCEPLPAPDASPLPWVERQILVDWPVKADVVGESPGTSALRDVNDLIGMETMQEWERILGPPPKPLPPTFLDVAKRGRPVLPVVETVTWRNLHADEEPRVWNFYGFNEDGTIIHDWWEEIRLNEQWAALRWERVKHRWAAKVALPPQHRMTVEGEVAFDDHCAECVKFARKPAPP